MKRLIPLISLFALSGVLTAVEPPASLKPEAHRRDPYDWMERHRLVLERHREVKPDYVVFGDSITHRWGGEPSYGCAQTGQEAWNMLFAGHTASNLGFGFDLIDNAWHRVALGELDGIRPRVIIVLLGTNNLGFRKDSAEICAANTKAFLDLIKEKCPNATILLLGVLPRLEEELASPIDRTNRLYEQLADGRTIIYAEPGKALQQQGSLLADRQYMSDSVHLNAAGYDELGRRLAVILETVDPEYKAAKNP